MYVHTAHAQGTSSPVLAADGIVAGRCCTAEMLRAGTGTAGGGAAPSGPDAVPAGAYPTGGAAPGYGYAPTCGPGGAGAGDHGGGRGGGGVPVAAAGYGCGYGCGVYGAPGDIPAALYGYGCVYPGTGYAGGVPYAMPVYPVAPALHAAGAVGYPVPA